MKKIKIVSLFSSLLMIGCVVATETLLQNDKEPTGNSSSSGINKGSGAGNAIDSFVANNKGALIDFSLVGLFEEPELKDKDAISTSWHWSDDVQYSNPGWIYHPSTSSGAVKNSFPRIFQKGDLGNRSLATIDRNIKAPSSGNDGFSIKIQDVSKGQITTGSINKGSNTLIVANPSGYKVGDAVRVSGMTGTISGGATRIDAIKGNVFTLRDKCKVSLENVMVTPPIRPSYWMWYNQKSFSESPEFYDKSEKYDRLSMYIYFTGYPTYTGGDPYWSFEMGTYNCWPGGSWQDKKDCPKEANNQHYYHQININPDGWVHVLWNKHPSHQRSVSGIGVVPNNPTTRFGEDKDYFDTMNIFYLEASRFSTQKNAAYWIGEMKFTSSMEIGEPQQNDETISNVHVGYFPGKSPDIDGHWEIGWLDLTPVGNHNSEYEVRWSSSPITNANFLKATLIEPQEYSVRENNIRKANTWKAYLWTKFTLPAEVMTNQVLYFAIKDVSSGQPGYRASPNDDIHVIDYILPAN